MATANLEAMSRLIDAVVHNDVAGVRATVATVGAGVKLDQPTGVDRYPPLLVATLHQAHDAMRALLELGANPNKGPQGWTPLMQAVTQHDRGAATILLDNGADINARGGSDDEGDRGATALMLAAEVGDLEMVNLLLGRGPDTKILTRQGRNAINFTLETSHGGDTRVLVDALLMAGMPAAGTCVARAVQDNDAELVRRILRAGGDPNLLTTRRDSLVAGMTPLMLALQKREMAEISRKVNRAMGQEEQTYRDKAVALEIMRELIAAGADVHRPSKMMGAPLDFAKSTNDAEAVELLSTAGVVAAATPMPVAPQCQHENGDARPAHAPIVATRTAGIAGARDFLKMIFDGHPEWSVLMVRAPIDAVINALKRQRTILDWQRNVPVNVAILQGAVPLDEIAVVQLKDSDWTILLRSLFDLTGVELEDVPTDAMALSKLLGTRAATFMGEDTAATMGYQRFDRGQCTELIYFSGGEVTTFESSLRSRPAIGDGDDAEIADTLLRELGVYLPCCIPQADAADTVYLAADKNAAELIERADVITLREA